MSHCLSIGVATLNVLGGLNNPFEFQGDYGSEVNLIREKVFELVVPREALVRHNQPLQTKLLYNAVVQDANHGPKLRYLVDSNLINELKARQEILEENGFTKDQLDSLLSFLGKFQDQKIFRFIYSKHYEMRILSASKPRIWTIVKGPIFLILGALRSSSFESFHAAQNSHFIVL